MKAKEILISLLLLEAFLFGVLLIGTQIQKYEKAMIERDTAEYQKAAKIAEVTLREKQVKNESIREDLETIRLQAFIKAYSHGEYIVEDFISEEKK